MTELLDWLKQDTAAKALLVSGFALSLNALVIGIGEFRRWRRLFVRVNSRYVIRTKRDRLYFPDVLERIYAPDGMRAYLISIRYRGPTEARITSVLFEIVGDRAFPVQDFRPTTLTYGQRKEVLLPPTHLHSFHDITKVIVQTAGHGSLEKQLNVLTRLQYWSLSRWRSAYPLFKGLRFFIYRDAPEPVDNST